MKKIKFSLILCSFLLLGNAMAQDNTVGIKGGLNISNIGGDAEGVSTKPGVHFGLFIQVETSDNVIFQPEFIYSMQGASLDGGEDAKANYNYLNFPLIFKIYPDQEGFNFQLGPQLGYLLSAEIAVDNVDFDIEDQLNTIDFGIGLGIGYDVDDIVLDARYNIGINSSAKDDSDGSFPLRTFQISLGVKF